MDSHSIPSRRSVFAHQEKTNKNARHLDQSSSRQLLKKSTKATLLIEDDSETDLATKEEIVIVEVTKRISSNSPFFDSNPPRTLPVFSEEEIQLGDILGEGQFGTVFEIKNITEESSILKKLEQTYEDGRSLDVAVMNNDDYCCHEQPTTMEEHRKRFAALDSFQSENPEKIEEVRQLLSLRCKNAQGQSRYAAKRLRVMDDEDYRFHGALDMALEATFLASLSHPNIVTLRGIVGVPGTDGFMLVLDRLYSTLQDKFTEWEKREKKQTRDRKKQRILGQLSLFHPKRRNEMIAHQDFFLERLYAAYDIARALKHLHEHHLIHRDIKPENVAYDIRGNIRIFDLGLAKELTEDILIELPEDYDCTGTTGSRRWMAPEVHLNLAYGPSADIYSFGLLLWNIFSLKVPFGNNISIEKHYQNVIMDGERPQLLANLPNEFNLLMVNCWHKERSRRPSIQKVCSIIRNQIEENIKLQEAAIEDEQSVLSSSSQNKKRLKFLQQQKRSASFSNKREIVEEDAVEEVDNFDCNVSEGGGRRRPMGSSSTSRRNFWFSDVLNRTEIFKLASNRSINRDIVKLHKCK